MVASLLVSFVTAPVTASAGPSFLQLSTETRPILRVAVAAVVPYGALQSIKWRDGLAVFAHSAKLVAAKSVHKTELIALLPDTLPNQKEESQVLGLIGLTPRFVPVPVPLEQVQNDFARMELGKVLGQFEQLKYYGAGLTEFDRVVIMDGDTIFLQPIDELMDDFTKVRVKGIYDHELDVTGSAFPPLNTGFMVFAPNKTDFDAINAIVREGDFREGSGWKGSRTGWTYGTGSQGILSFYYNQVQPGVEGYLQAEPVKGKDLPGMDFTVQPPTSRFLPLDRSVYNVIDTELLREAVNKGLVDASRVKVFHFTGGCLKPWLCYTGGDVLCEEMHRRWWALRTDLARAWGGDEAICPGGEYKALPLPKSAV